MIRRIGGKEFILHHTPPEIRYSRAKTLKFAKTMRRLNPQWPVRILKAHDGHRTVWLVYCHISIRKDGRIRAPPGGR